jgi:hypothetical protein
MEIPLTPRVAVVMTGLPRFGADTDTLILNLKNYRYVDWYICFWQHQPQACSALDARWQGLSVEEISYEISSRLPADHTLKSFHWANERDFEPMPRDYPPFFSYPKNTWQQYQLFRAQWLTIHQDHYDLVVRGRADGGMDRPIDLAQLHQSLLASPLTLVTPDNQRQGPHQFCDHMAIGRPTAMDHLARAVELFDSAWEQGVPYNAEILLGNILTAQGVSWPASGWNSTLKSQGANVDGVFQPRLGRWALDK